MSLLADLRAGHREIEQAGPSIWTIEASDHVEDLDEYRVDPSYGACTCPQFQHRRAEEGGWCKHLLAVALIEGVDVIGDESFPSSAPAEPDGGQAVATDGGRVSDFPDFEDFGGDE